MAKQISLRELEAVDFAPKAVVRCPMAYFSDQLGFVFEKDVDDLDEYESAFFGSDTITIGATKLGLPFALIRYRGNPLDRVTIYLARALDSDIVTKFVETIVSEFNLSKDNIEWVSAEVPPRRPEAASDR
jgi:hypothetical protein